MDGLDEIEEFEDLDDLDDGNKGGFQFFAQPKSKVNNAGPISAPKQGAPAGLGLNSVTPLMNVGGGQGGRKSSSYGKKIGFSDDFDDDWDSNDNKGKGQEAE